MGGANEVAWAEPTKSGRRSLLCHVAGITYILDQSYIISQNWFENFTVATNYHRQPEITDLKLKSATIHLRDFTGLVMEV